MAPSVKKRRPAHYGAVRDAQALGAIARAHRKRQSATLEEISGVSGLGMRFLSELERGKPTAQIQKALIALNTMGLDMVIVPRRLTPEVLRLINESSDD